MSFFDTMTDADFVDLPAPRKRSDDAEVVLGLIPDGRTGALQVMLSDAVARQVAGEHRQMWARYAPAVGVLRLVARAAGGYALRVMPRSGRRLVRLPRPDGVTAPVSDARFVPEWRVGDGHIDILLPPELRGSAGRVAVAVPAVDGESDYIDRLCADPEPSEAAVAASVPAEARPTVIATVDPALIEARSIEVEARPIIAATGDAPDVPAIDAKSVTAGSVLAEAVSATRRKPGRPRAAAKAREFEVIRLGAARVRTTDLPWLRDLAAGKTVTTDDGDDWRRVREEMRDVDVLMPVGCGRLAPQSRAVLAKLLKTYDASKVAAAAGVR